MFFEMKKPEKQMIYLKKRFDFLEDDYLQSRKIMKKIKRKEVIELNLNGGHKIIETRPFENDKILFVIKTNYNNKAIDNYRSIIVETESGISEISITLELAFKSYIGFKHKENFTVVDFLIKTIPSLTTLKKESYKINLNAKTCFRTKEEIKDIIGDVDYDSIIYKILKEDKLLTKNTIYRVL